jgi:hypothetical protein
MDNYDKGSQRMTYAGGPPADLQFDEATGRFRVMPVRGSFHGETRMGLDKVPKRDEVTGRIITRPYIDKATGEERRAKVMITVERFPWTWCATRKRWLTEAEWDAAYPRRRQGVMVSKHDDLYLTLAARQRGGR